MNSVCLNTSLSDDKVDSILDVPHVLTLIDIFLILSIKIHNIVNVKNFTYYSP